MKEYVFLLRLTGWVVIFMVPAVVMVGNWITSVVDPNRCPALMTCVGIK